MEVIPTAIAGPVLLRMPVHGDARGSFSEVFKRDALAEAGLPHAFIQDNQSCSALPGTLRGLHWQAPPFAQTKLVRVLRGAVLDIAVDLRRGSLTHGQHVAVELSATNRLQFLVPRGFAHGFLTLEPETLLLYKVDAAYAPAHERGIHHADPDLALPWPATPAVTVISPKDSLLPLLRDLADAHAD